ncbi:hypothetical protein AHMF7605_07780 [Adhaeribacter arboris]|uniref:Uncharacterized protein n=1 Tax=Adhaeribacter arboris TaxID=2072846 RepID=A0A2T2YD35_9BACT|nr:hypothetical protein [Adhaeribacter arboris]PSR53432.1 hypothetical protein AHMF7605_07780 [Adhaeribacter arboris]
MKEPQDILQRAIAQLPSYPAPAKVWPLMEQTLDQERNPQPLHQAVQELKTTILLAPLAWENLEEKLNQQEELVADKNTVPEGKTTPSIFRGMRKRAGKAAQPVFARGYVFYAVVACILLFLGVFWYYQTIELPQEPSLTYSQEIVAPLNLTLFEASLSDEDEVLDFVRENCQTLQEKCTNSKFRGLLNEYLELEAARHELTGQLNQHQEQTQLMNYLVRIEKEKTEVGKQLLQLLLI